MQEEYDQIMARRKAAIETKAEVHVGAFALLVVVTFEATSIRTPETEWCSEALVVKQLSNEFELAEDKLTETEATAPWWARDFLAKKKEGVCEFCVGRGVAVS